MSSGFRILDDATKLISKSPITETPKNAKPSWVPGRLPMSGINLEKENKLTGLGSNKEVNDVRYVPKPESDGSETINAPDTHITTSNNEIEPTRLLVAD